MNPMLITGIIVLSIFAIFGIVIWMCVRYENKRIAELHRTALMMGFTPLTELPQELQEHLSQIVLMNTGRNRITSNIFQKQIDGRDVFVFDYQYAIGSGKSQHIPQQTVVLFVSDQIETPRFLLKPESWQNRLIEAFGGQDIDFEEAREFSGKFVLQGDDEPAIRQFFNSLRLQSLSSINDLCLESRPGCLLFWYDRRRVKPEDLQDLIEQANQTCQLLC